MSQAETLYRLQQIETHLLQSRRRLKAIADELADDEAVQTARAAVTTAQNILNPLRAKARDLEHDIRTNEEKSQQASDQLYSGNVKNPKEMQDLQQEIEALKRWHGELETQLLETLYTVEEAENALQAAEAQLTQATSQWASGHEQLLAEQRELKTAIDHDKQRREQVITEIQPPILAIYEDMKPRKRNMPVALMTGNTCSVCGVGQNMAIERSVRQGRELTYCTNCGRILVASD